LHDPNFNRLRLIHPCDGQTDGRLHTAPAKNTAAISCDVWTVERENFAVYCRKKSGKSKQASPQFMSEFENENYCRPSCHKALTLI